MPVKPWATSASPVLIVRSADRTRPGKKYCIGGTTDQHGAPAPAQHQSQQSGKRNHIQSQVCSDAHAGGSKQLIRDREICPNSRQNEAKSDQAGCAASQYTSHESKWLWNVWRLRRLCRPSALPGPCRICSGAIALSSAARSTRPPRMIVSLGFVEELRALERASPAPI